VNSIDVTIAGPQFAEIKKLHLRIIENVFAQFLPEIGDSPGSDNFYYATTDVEFFVKFANEKMPPVEEVSPDNLNEKTCSCISLSKFKFHLDNILCRGWSKSKGFAKPLNLYKTEVRLTGHLYVVYVDNTCMFIGLCFNW